MFTRDAILSGAAAAANADAPAFVGPNGPARSADPVWNSIPALQARRLQAVGHRRTEWITERIAELQASDADWIVR